MSNTQANTPSLGGPVALGAVSLDLQRLSVDELVRLLQALQAEVRRRHAGQHAEPGRLATRGRTPTETA
jgi:uncharacterized small protein (DUF1192 family)